MATNYIYFLNIIFIGSIFFYFKNKFTFDKQIVFLILFLFISETFSFKYSIIDELAILIFFLFNFKSIFFNLKYKFKDIDLITKIILILLITYLFFNFSLTIYFDKNYLILAFLFLYLSAIILFINFQNSNPQKFDTLDFEIFIKFLAILIISIVINKFMSENLFNTNFNLLQGKTWSGSARLSTIFVFYFLLVTVFFSKMQNMKRYILLFMSLVIFTYVANYFDSRSLMLICFFFVFTNFLIIKKMIYKFGVFLSLLPFLITHHVDMNYKKNLENRVFGISNDLKNNSLRKNYIITFNGTKFNSNVLIKRCKYANNDSLEIQSCVRNFLNDKFELKYNFITVFQNRLKDNLKNTLNINVFISEKIDLKDDLSENINESNISRKAHYRALYHYFNDTNIVKLFLGNGFYSHKTKMSKFFSSAYEELSVENFNFRQPKKEALQDAKSKTYRTNSLISLFFDVGIIGLVLFFYLIISNFFHFIKKKNIYFLVLTLFCSDWAQ